MHFLAWDFSTHPLNMDRVPMTVSDLVEMTRQINLSISNFFAGTGIRDYPVIDGVSNGWAGNSIYHQHFQFFRPEEQPPIASNPNLVDVRHPVLVRDDVKIHKMSWCTPVYRVEAEDSLNVGLVGNDIAGIWKVLGGSEEVPIKDEEGGRVPAHTQNIYVVGARFGKTAYILLRDRRHISYPSAGARDPVDSVSSSLGSRDPSRAAPPKGDIGVLEASGSVIVDDGATFNTMSGWEPSEITTYINLITSSISPEPKRVDEFEAALRRLFPQ
jgi:hypothetical protein